MDVISLAKINELKKSGGVGYEETAKTVVFQQNTLTLPYDSVEGAVCLMISPAPFEIVSGKEYEVTWNGDTYKLVGIYVSENADISYVFIGNPVITGGENNGVPFFMGFVSVGGKSEFAIYAIEATEDMTVSLSVSTEAETVHTIDPKFLPSGGGGGISSYALKTVIKGGTSVQLLCEEDCAFLDKQAEKKEGFVCNWIEDRSHTDDPNLTCFMSSFLTYNGVSSQGEHMHLFAFIVGTQILKIGKLGDGWIASYETFEG